MSRFVRISRRQHVRFVRILSLRRLGVQVGSFAPGHGEVTSLRLRNQQLEVRIRVRVGAVTLSHLWFPEHLFQ